MSDTKEDLKQKLNEDIEELPMSQNNVEKKHEAVEQEEQEDISDEEDEIRRK